MPLSRPCDECWSVKRVRAYPVDNPEAAVLGALVYLCRPCARALGYVTPERRGEKVSL